ncbi:DNA-binding response regulator [Streptomyces sp. NBRC 14336]|uniref:response regulator transcription factor n=1 Tax=Streptomyces sp. NBRC 14336 TaxID=3030992 RepID=UPI0024A1AE7A|nr:response regulator transcription factor [Streptomyces sp. NBRC 14336]WBO75735.1 response regulator transcription factor [Streptomyces sp. SBE_14.2]GLW49456.1 DNA-binding response regulator [Streptomyces sp. NBRC 14336]
MRVLVVEDEEDLAEMIADGLRSSGIVADVAFDGGRAMEMAAAADYDVLVLDRDLPGIHGDAVCRMLTTNGYPARILMLTAAGSLADLVDGLGKGADDYLAKPFSYVELVARLQALARRGPSGTPTVLERHGLRLDTVRRIAERDGRLLRLTPKELGVLEALMSADGSPLRAADLLEMVWDYDTDPESTTVKVTVHQLRRKLGPPPLIETVPGFGYRL